MLILAVVHHASGIPPGKIQYGVIRGLALLFNPLLLASCPLAPQLLGFGQVSFLFRTNFGTFLYLLFAARRIDEPLLRSIEPIGGLWISFAVIRRWLFFHGEFL
jgi:hypothetical protein